MSEFEYSTFVLGRCLTPAAKYSKVNQDIADATSVPFWRKNKSRIKTLKMAKKRLESEYDKSQLSFTSDEEEIKYYVEVLAKRSAVELLSTGKVSTETMTDMTCLGDEWFKDCVKRSTIIASQLNHEVKNVEKSVQQDDVVPENMM